jgi:hypothetical protein
MLSNSAARSTADSIVIQDGHTYVRINATTVRRYVVSSSARNTGPQGALLDGGANGGMIGQDMRVLFETESTCDVTGVADNAVSNLKIVTGASLIETTNGPIIGIFNQYANYGQGKTIHAKGQLESFGNEVDDTSRRLGGQQRLITHDGKVIPVSIRQGLPYIDMRSPTDDELATYPHVIMTSDVDWDPSVLDNEFTPDDPEAPEPDTTSQNPRLNDYGEVIRDHADYVNDCCISANSQVVTRNEHDYDRLRPYFGWCPLQRLKHTLRNTTQWYRASLHYPMKHHFKSRFPAANVPRWNEIVATDTFFSDTAALDDGILGHGGATMVQLYAGKTSNYTKAYPMKREGEMSHTLEDLIREVGAPSILFSDNAKAQTSKEVLEILRFYAIGDFQCEPYHQHQNAAERQIQEVKRLTNSLMDRTGTPAGYWLLCLFFVVNLLNHLSLESLQWKTPIETAFGQKPDISAFLHFRWWEPVFFDVPTDTRSFPSESTEVQGRWVGIAEKQGDVLTYLVLNEATGRVVARSNVRSALQQDDVNLRATSTSNGGEQDPNTMETTDGVATGPTVGEHCATAAEGGSTSAPPNIKSTHDIAGIQVNPLDLKLPYFSPEELIGRNFLHEVDGQKLYATVVKKILDRDAENHDKIKMLVAYDNGQIEEIIAYNVLSDLIEEQDDRDLNNDPETLWEFDKILGHQGPLRSTDRFYKGSSYNVLVQWTTGEETFEPLDVMIKTDPITVAAYAKDNGLLTTPGWKNLNKYVRRAKKFKRMLNQARLASKRRGIRYKFGVRIPRNHPEAVRLDEENKNRLWQDSVDTEFEQVDEYETFEDKGVGYRPPSDYKKINVHLIFDVKHDLRRKARLVAGGHLTDPPKDSSYSGVVSLRSLRLVALLAELNGLELWAADVGNAYLEARTKEKVYIIAGPEFGARAGHVLIIIKALYGLKTSGARWHERLADVLRDLGFEPSKADPDVWLKDCDTHYEYVCVYVDDQALAMKEPQKFCDILKDKYGFKLKGVGPISYHLGADIWRDPDGTLCFGAKTYIERMINNYEAMFGEKPTPANSPLEQNAHPELDLSEELGEDGIKKYQSLIGALQWAISLCRIDIHMAVMTLSRFRTAPRIGHMTHVQRVCGYLRKYPDAAIRFRIGIPTKTHETPPEWDWEYAVYGRVHEELPTDMPVPKGKPVRTTSFVDANLFHDLTTGRAAMGVIHMVNQCPIEWFCKRQNTVETATYGSEFVAAKTATEQIIDLRYTLRMFGVPLDGPAWMFGDNNSVVISSTIPHSTLMKRHNALAYHRVREAIAAKILHFLHMSGTQNPADILTKFLAPITFHQHVTPLLFWKGETFKSTNSQEGSVTVSGYEVGAVSASHVT